MTSLDSTKEEYQTILKYFKVIEEHEKKQIQKKMETNIQIIQTNRIFNKISEIRKSKKK